MKKVFGIILAIIVLALTLTLAVACDPDGKTPQTDQSVHTITFDSKGGEQVESITAQAGSDISLLLPADPAKSELFFGGWSLEDNGFSSSKAELPTVMPEEDVTYYARWTRHAVVVPMLQSLGEDGLPDGDKATYVRSPEYSVTIEVDPASSTVDLYANGNRPNVKGFFDSSTEEEHTITVDVKEKTVSLYYDRDNYNVIFDLNDPNITSSFEGTWVYFGQQYELPSIPLSVNVPLDMRFAGWASDADGNDFVPFGEVVTVGEDSILSGDGESGSVTLYAVYDKGYCDLSGGFDYVFLPRDAEDVAIIRRAGLIDFEGQYIKNQTPDQDTTPHIGEFFIYNNAGTLLNGYVYADGHFAYKQDDLDPALRGAIFGGCDPKYNVLEGTTIEFIDMYGGAKLTLSAPVTFVSEAGRRTFAAGEYMGGYWQDDSMGDLCFSMFDELEIEGEDGEEPTIETVQYNMHFRFVMLQGAEQEMFQIQGAEVGLFCDGVDIDGNILGDRVLLDGYGVADLILANGQYTGQYSEVSEDAYLVVAQSSTGAYREMLIRPDFDTIYGYITQSILVMPYEKGDSALLVNCENADGSTFEADGFGHGVYTPAEGDSIEGTVQLQGALFASSSPAVAYKLSAGENTYSIIVDQTSESGKFEIVTGDVDINYLYSNSELVSDYVGAIVSAKDAAYYLTAAQTSYGNTAFGDIVKGSVQSNGGGYVFTSAEYVIAYADDATLTKENDIPTVSTAQINLNEITFAVKDANGATAGTLKVTAAGKATYEHSGDGFEALDYYFSYSSVMVKQGEEDRIFVVDSFGATPTALVATKYALNVADGGQVGTLYQFNDGGDKAIVWMIGDDDAPHFYAIAAITEATGDNAHTADGSKVYLIQAPQASIRVLKADDGYLAASTRLETGTYSLADNSEKIELDAFGHIKYTISGAEGDTEYIGTYGYKEGVLCATFEEAESFKFSTATDGSFAKVDYSQYFVVNPMALSIIAVMRVTGTQANMHNAVENSDGTIGIERNPASKGTISAGLNDVYTFSGDTVTFSFCYNDSAFDQRVMMRQNTALPNGTFNEDGAKSITLDQYGRAKYSDGNGNEYEGYYFNSAGMYRFLSHDGKTDVRFTIDAAKSTLSVYDPTVKPDASGTYDVTSNGNAYKLQVDFAQLSATLLNGENALATDTLDVDEDGIYTFEATDANSVIHRIMFIISDKKLVQYDNALDYQLDIYMGNLYLFEQGITYLGSNAVVSGVGRLVVKGFTQIAELVSASGSVIKGSITQEDDEILFEDENGNYQQLVERSLSYGGGKYLGAYGTEMGAAIYFFAAMNAGSMNYIVYFDGFGKAYNASASGTPTTLKGYYYIGEDPYSQSEHHTSGYIVVGNFAEGGTNEFVISESYYAYSLSSTATDGTVTYLTGVVAYDESKNTVALADDGSLFSFNGYDMVEYYDSVGVSHTGYFNNYGLAAYGEADNRYIIVDQYDNMTLYFIYFDGEKDESGLVRARRGSYIVNSQYSELYAEIQLVYEEDFEDMFGAGQSFEEGKDGYALLVLVIGDDETSIGGFFTIEGGYMTIEVKMTNGTTEEIQIRLFVDGTAEWMNISEWLQ